MSMLSGHGDRTKRKRKEKKLWEYVAREWKFGQTASLAIHNLKFPSYDEPLPPSGVKNKGEIVSEAELNVTMYLQKKEMEIIYDTKITIRPICTGPTE